MKDVELNRTTIEGDLRLSASQMRFDGIFLAVVLCAPQTEFSLLLVTSTQQIFFDTQCLLL